MGVTNGKVATHRMYAYIYKQRLFNSRWYDRLLEIVLMDRASYNAELKPVNRKGKFVPSSGQTNGKSGRFDTYYVLWRVDAIHDGGKASGGYV